MAEGPSERRADKNEDPRHAVSLYLHTPYTFRVSLLEVLKEASIPPPPTPGRGGRLLAQHTPTEYEASSIPLLSIRLLTEVSERPQ